jgi:spermidine/putrescine transport system substrate-binding protein
MGDSSHSSKYPDWLNAPITRRDVLKRGAILAAIPTLSGGLAGLVSACGGSESAGETSASPSVAAEPKGTAVFLTFPGWIGSTQLADFSAAYPGAKVKLSTNLPSSIAGVVQLIKNNPGAYDIGLGDPAFVGQAQAAGVYQAPDWSLIPNIELVDERFRTAYPDALPTDWGIDVLAYRKDIVKEPITKWADLWELGPKYSGQIVVQDLDRDTIAMALKYLGYSGNSTSEAEINQAKDALIELKPYLQAITSLNVGTGLAKGSIAMAHTINYEAALAQDSNPNVEFIMPAEGSFGYVEGFVPLTPSEHLDVVHAFLNFSMDPKVYADFVNTTGSSWTSSAAEPYINKALLDKPALKPTPEQLDQVEWTKFLGEATVYYGQAWQEFKAA